MDGEVLSFSFCFLRFKELSEMVNATLSPKNEYRPGLTHEGMLAKIGRISRTGDQQAGNGRFCLNGLVVF